MESILILWFVLSLVAGWIAANKKRSGGGIFFLSLLLSPLVGLLVALAMAPGQPDAATSKVCPYCAETIKAEAMVCRYCQRDQRIAAGIDFDDVEVRP